MNLNVYIYFFIFLGEIHHEFILVCTGVPTLLDLFRLTPVFSIFQAENSSHSHQHNLLILPTLHSP